jgi:hypothetical protein
MLEQQNITAIHFFVWTRVIGLCSVGNVERGTKMNTIHQHCRYLLRIFEASLSAFWTSFFSVCNINTIYLLAVCLCEFVVKFLGNSLTCASTLCHQLVHRAELRWRSSDWGPLHSQGPHLHASSLERFCCPWHNIHSSCIFSCCSASWRWLFSCGRLLIISRQFCQRMLNIF